ncbi:acetyl-CoA carboxylase carboxyl transferase subunit alpha [Lactobacillus sp. DCY120]|uniref:acetyl-CoA carboxytransferase n=1 Tax=Bombilactobacillus apium TaxID=2675299 RepID=A0A850R7N7_9LACO|nr:carboxyl transferase domain-containing protein [Bombilactobacillus apium]NVY96692.1 acetyl-CoA carboxylase carboxyl transferase subunit alpha [Bombilactobacillus apium]
MSKTEIQKIMNDARSDTKADMNALVDHLFTNFVNCKGDRVSGDNAAIIAGFATIADRAVAVISTNKGQELKERLQTNFGSPTPAGYRKALRVMETASELHLPIITLINTPGAYPGADAEAAGQGQVIAHSIQKMLTLPVPILTIIVGEAGSGGALALACSDQIWMFAHSMYTVLSPEGFASIMWKDAQLAPKAAEVMHIEPEWLQEHQVVDQILPEEWLDFTDQQLQEKILQQLAQFDQLSVTELLQQRQARFRQF